MTASRAWERKLDDPTYPLLTIGVVAELLEVDVQVVRRLEERGIVDPARPAGNQRRYARADVERLAQALELVGEGVNGDALDRIVELEARLSELESELERRDSVG